MHRKLQLFARRKLIWKESRRSAYQTANKIGLSGLPAYLQDELGITKRSVHMGPFLLRRPSSFELH